MPLSLLPGFSWKAKQRSKAMGENYGKLKKIIGDSSLDTETRQGLIYFFKRARDSELEPIVELCFEDPDWIYRISENYREKLQAFETEDIEMWNQIINKEAEQLSLLGA